MSKLKRLLSLVLVGVLFCTPTFSVYASSGSSTQVTTSGSSTVSGSGSSTGWVYYNEDGFKLNTYILATTDLDYMNNLPEDIQSYIINGREGMKQVKGSTSIKSFMKKYTSKVSYFGKGDQTYISDYYQQLGNPLSFILNGDGGHKPGFVGMTTSPKSHLSNFEEDNFNKSSKLEDIVDYYRSEIKLVKANKIEMGNSSTNLGTYVDLSQDKWVKGLEGVNDVGDLSNVIGTKGFLEFAIKSSVASGLFYNGVSTNKLNKKGISVYKESNNSKVNNEIIHVTDIEVNKQYLFSMKKNDINRVIKCKGYYNSGNSKVKVKFSCKQLNLLDAFLLKYSVNGTEYTWNDLCPTTEEKAKNFGLNVSVVVVLEPLKLSYHKGNFSSGEKKLYYGEYADSASSDPYKNGLMLSIRDRAYIRENNHNTGYEVFNKQRSSSGNIKIDEKYSAGLCLNYVAGNKLNSEDVKIMKKMNPMMYSGSSYCEFPKVKSTGNSKRCKNNKSFKYKGAHDEINESIVPFNGTTPTNNLVGGVACIGYYHEMDLDSGSNINPFPSLTVRHIDNTALAESIGTENVLMRDSITWTLPASLGLAIEHDLAVATYLTENKGLFYAYGNDESSVSYAELDEYLSYSLKKTKSLKTRFGNHGEGDFKDRLKVALDSMNQKTYKYNGINVKTMSFRQILAGAKEKSDFDSNSEQDIRNFMAKIYAKDNGDNAAKSEFYKWCIKAIIDHYSDYKVRIPLLRDSKSNLGTGISSNNVFWGVSAKPLTTCSGSYEYYDGAILSGDSNGFRGALTNSIEKLNETNVSDWDVVEKRDTEGGNIDGGTENILGETTKVTNQKLKFPSARAISALDYYIEDGMTQSNVPKNSKKSKFNFYYGLDFTMDRTIGGNNKYHSFKEINDKTYLEEGTLDTGSDEEDAYLPTAKVIKSYADVMYDVSVFNNSVGFMEKNYDQSIDSIVDNAVQLHESNSSGIKSWSYLIFPEFSLGSRMLLGHSCTNKIADVDVYSNLKNYEDTDLSVSKDNRNTKEPLMVYWNSTKYEAPLGGDVNVRDNMFFGNCERGYNNVWVPDLGNNKVNFNKAEIKSTSSDNGSQTATSKMFDVTERIYGITLAYNPNMGSADSWTYRIGSGYTEEKKDINNNGSNAIPSKCKVNLATEGAISAEPFLDRCDKLGVDETLFSMPDEIPKLEDINRGGEKRNFIKYSNNGWKFLKGKFDNSGTEKYTALMSSNDVYTLNLSDGSKPNANYVEINAGDWITYGDLGTLDAYYDTVPTSKIYDVSLDLDTDDEGLERFTMNELLLTDNYLIKKNNITNGYTINNASTKYNMKLTCGDRDFNPDGRKYIGTISIKGNDLELLSKTISSGDKCLSMLRSNNVLYQIEDQIVDLKAGLLALKSDEVIYYVNIWAKSSGVPEEIKGDRYIRSDELVSAAKFDVPDDSLTLKAIAKDDCGTPGHSNGDVSDVVWNKFRESAKNPEPWRVMSSNLGSKNPFTILGKTENGSKKYGMEWLGSSGNTWKNGYYVNGDTMTIPSGLSVGVLLHRSMLDSSTKDYSKTPPLAEYMKNTSANKKYKDLCKEYAAPYTQYSGKGYLESDNYTGWSSGNAIRTLKFNLYGDLNTSKGGDLNYFTDFDAKYSCVYGNNIVDHSGKFVDKNYKIKATVGTEKISSDVAVEGIYIPNSSDSESKKPEIVTSKVPGGTDTEILYKVPTKVSFRPTFLMRADYDVNNYENDNIKYTAHKKDGNREKVWMLGAKERTMNVYNLHSLKMSALEDVKVQAPWSTDKLDRDNYKTGTKKPTVKAGSAYKIHKTGVNLQVQSTIYMLDESFYSGDALTEVKKFNEQSLKSHEELLDKIKGIKDNSNGARAFGYSSLPGGYDEELAREVPAFKNEFTNVIGDKREKYSDSEFAKVFEKTKIKTKVEIPGVDTVVDGVYLNKHYDDADYTDKDFEGSRGMSIKVDGKSFNLNPEAYDIKDSILTKGSSTEVNKCKDEAAREFYRQLHSATKAGMSWYKEDFEGVLQVTITSTVHVSLDTDYSIIWDNLSDWRDRVGVKPYNVGKPALVPYDGSSSVNVVGESPNATVKIPAGDVGAGYGFMFKDIELGGVKYGTACLLTNPYLFEVRGNVYDDISK